MNQHLDNQRTISFEDGTTVTLHYAADEDLLQDCIVRVLQKHMAKEQKNAKNKSLLL